MIRILKPCQRELENLPLEVREDLADALARLEEGHLLSMPLSRPMPSIAKGVHELRLRYSTGSYLVHAFKKKSQQTPFQAIELVRKRLKMFSGT